MAGKEIVVRIQTVKPEPDNRTNDKVRALADEVHEALVRQAADAALEKIEAGFVLAANAHVELSEEALFRLAQAALALVERGGWAEVQACLPQLKPPPKGQPIVALSAGLVRGHCLRRQGQLDRAHDAYVMAQECTHRPGPLYSLLALHAGHTTRLLGHYGEALLIYDRLAQTPAPDASARTVMAAKRARADIFMLRGQFEKALAVLETLDGAVGDDPLWDIETARLRAHVLRYNFELDDAERIYTDCLRAVERLGAGALRGELLTDIAQTRCWSDPAQAMADAQAAIEVNQQTGASIEVGKALAAQAIAQALTGDSGSAKVAAEVSFGKQSETGYRAGEVFALQAKGVALAARGDRAGVEQIIAAMDSFSAERTVYPFVSAPLHVWAGMPLGADRDGLGGAAIARIKNGLKNLQMGAPSEGFSGLAAVSGALD